MVWGGVQPELHELLSMCLLYCRSYCRAGSGTGEVPPRATTPHHTTRALVR